MNPTKTLNRTAPPELAARRNQSLLFSSAFLMSIGTTGIGLLVPLLALNRLGATDLQLGIIAAIRQIVVTLTVGEFGKLCDRIGHKIQPVIAALVIGLAGCLLYEAKSISIVYGLMVLLGLGTAAFWPAMEANTGEGLDGLPLLRSINIYNICWAMGAALGPYIGGYIFSKSLLLDCLLMGLIALISGTCLLFLCENSDSKEHKSSPEKIKDNRIPKDPYLRAGWLANFGGWLCAGILCAIFPSMCKKLGLSSTQTGVLIFIWGLVMSVAFAVLRLSVKWTYRRLPLVAGQILLALGFLMYYIGSSFYVLALGSALTGIGCGITYSSSLFYSMNKQTRRGMLCGKHELILQAASLTGPLVAGLISTRCGFRTPYLFCILVVFFCMAIGFCFLTAQKKLPDSQNAIS